MGAKCICDHSLSHFGCHESAFDIDAGKRGNVSSLPDMVQLFQLRETHCPPLLTSDWLVLSECIDHTPAHDSHHTSARGQKMRGPTR